MDGKENGMLRVCKKCLLRELAEDEFLENLERYIESLSWEERVEQTVYETRLRICNECEQLTRGMCRKCGCYVELRTAQKNQRCPMVPAKWGRIEIGEYL